MIQVLATIKISKYLLSTRKQLNQVIFVCIFDKYCMYRQFTSYIFSVLFFLLRITFFKRKASSKMYHYCAIFVQSLSAYTPTDR